MNIKKALNNKGFTLMEAIISIAVLSLISGFILQMFITSQNANQRAQDMDSASAKAISVIEQFKASDSQINFLDKFSSDHNEFDISQSVNSEESFYTVYYDENWKQTDEKNSYKFILTIELIKNSEDINYINEFSYKLDGANTEYTTAQTDGMHEISVKIVSVDKQAQNPKDLVSYNACKYYTV